MTTYTIGQLPNTATEINKEAYIAIWQNGATKKINFQDLEKYISHFCHIPKLSITSVLLIS